MYSYSLIGAVEKDGTQHNLNNRLSWVTFCDLQTGGKVAIKNIKATLKRECIDPKQVTKIIINSVYNGVIEIDFEEVSA